MSHRLIALLIVLTVACGLAPATASAAAGSDVLAWIQPDISTGQSTVWENSTPTGNGHVLASVAGSVIALADDARQNGDIWMLSNSGSGPNFASAIIQVTLAGATTVVSPNVCAGQDGIGRGFAVTPANDLVVVCGGQALLVDGTTGAITNLFTVPYTSTALSGISVSPDGSEVAYVLEGDGGVFTKYVRPLTGGTAAQVPAYGQTGPGVSWTSAGQLLFSDCGDIYTESPTGGGGTVILSGLSACEAVESPDGTWLAYFAGNLAVTSTTPGAAVFPITGSESSVVFTWIAPPDKTASSPSAEATDGIRSLAGMLTRTAAAVRGL